VLVQGLFDRGGGDHHVSRRRRGHDVDIRRDRENRGKHGGRRMVGHDDQRGWSRDERDGVVVLSVGGAKPRSISRGPEQLGGFVDVLINAYVSRNGRTSRQRISRSANQHCVALCCVDESRVYGRGCGWGAPRRHRMARIGGSLAEVRLHAASVTGRRLHYVSKP
jgi:hypothetical protein